MGEINSVVTVQSVYSNPAILPWIRIKELSMQHLIYLSDTQYSVLAYNHPLDKETALGFSLGYLGMSGLTRTVADDSVDGYHTDGNFGYSDAVAGISYGAKTSINLSYGVTVKAMQESIDGTTSSALTATVSGFYFPRKRRDYMFGFGITDIGTRSREFDTPTGVYGSFGRYVNDNLFWAGEAITYLNLWGGDAFSYLDRGAELRTGIEYSINEALALRLGYRYHFNNPETGTFPMSDITGGIGFNFSQFSFDYAWLPYGDLGITHRMTLTARIGKKINKEARKVIKAN